MRQVSPINLQSDVIVQTLLEQHILALSEALDYEVPHG
jgi:hypothetical protein